MNITTEERTTEYNDGGKLRKLFLLDRDIIFLNHGSFGSCPVPVFEAYQNWQRKLEFQPVKFLDRNFPILMAEARTDLSNYLGTAPDNIVFVTNATTAVNTIARSLPIQEGDQVLSTNHEYGATEKTWEFICRKRKAKYIKSHIPLKLDSPEQIIEAVWSGVTPKTRVLFLSHITSVTAAIFPIKELIDRARSANIITVIDGAHAPGQIPLSLDELDADFYAGNCHKWMMAPKGAGFLFARPEAQKLLDPLVVSWGWGSEKPGISPFIDTLEFQGTKDISAYLSVSSSIRFMRDFHWNKVRSKCHELLRFARNEICSLTGFDPLLPDSKDWYGQMATFRLPACDIDKVKTTLYDKFSIEIPVLDWEKIPLIRVSIQGYNSEKDVETLLEALKQIFRTR